jgi:hypothetical protein
MQRSIAVVCVLTLSLSDGLSCLGQSQAAPAYGYREQAAETQKVQPNNSTAAAAPKPNTLLDGTPIKLRIARNVSSADAKVGEHVDFEVLEEIQVSGVVVIAKGATASATVTDVQAKRRMGRAGRLDINLDSVRLADGEKAALTATAGGKGGSHTGAMIGAMAVTAIFTLGGSALFLLMHGKDITIPKGAETTAYVNGDMPLNMAQFALPSGTSPLTTASASTQVAGELSKVSVDANAENCDIEVDGSFAGSTPSQLSLTYGKHDVVINKKGYQPWTRTLTVSGPEIHLHAELDAVPAA